MTGPSGPHRISRKERIARAAVGMPAHHPELITHAPRHAEWKQLATWCAELWPDDEYTALVTDTWHQDQP